MTSDPSRCPRCRWRHPPEGPCVWPARDKAPLRMILEREPVPVPGPAGFAPLAPIEPETLPFPEAEYKPQGGRPRIHSTQAARQVSERQAAYRARKHKGGYP